MTWPFYAWLVTGAALLVGELLTGTFFLLIFGVAAWLGAAAAWLGVSVNIQMGIVGAAAILGLAIVIPWRRRQAKSEARVVDMDVGNNVHVISVLDGCNLRVSYRGAEWSARLETGDATALAPGKICTIAAVEGNNLLVKIPD